MRMFYDLEKHCSSWRLLQIPIFCFGGQCCTPNVFASPKTETLTPNGDAITNGHPISIHYDEATTRGGIKY